MLKVKVLTRENEKAWAFFETDIVAYRGAIIGNILG